MTFNEFQPEEPASAKQVAYHAVTLRDYFAAKAMGAMSDCLPWAMDLDGTILRFADISYRMADAMLEARKK